MSKIVKKKAARRNMMARWAEQMLGLLQSTNKPTIKIQILLEMYENEKERTRQRIGTVTLSERIYNLVENTNAGQVLTSVKLAQLSESVGSRQPAKMLLKLSRHGYLKKTGENHKNNIYTRTSKRMPISYQAYKDLHGQA